MGLMGEVAGFEIEDGNVVVNYNVNEDVVNIDFLNKNTDMVKRNAAMMFNNPTGNIKALFDVLEDVDAGLILKFNGVTTGKVASVTLTTNDIDEYLNSKEEKDPQAILESQVEITNAQCPIHISPGMNVVNITIEGEYVVYNVECDETSYSIAALNANKNQIKQAVVNGLDSNDPTMAMFMKICKDAGKGISYKYKGDKSGETCTIELSASGL